MRCVFLLIASTLLLAASGNAMAATHARAPAARAGTAADPVQLRQHLKRSAAEVKQLQRDVATQESRSRQADERLREQDRALEQLRRQLQATRQAPVVQDQG